MSQIPPGVFSLENLLFIWERWTEMTPQRSKTLISPARNRIKNLRHTFQVDTNKNTMQKKLLVFFTA